MDFRLFLFPPFLMQGSTAHVAPCSRAVLAKGTVGTEVLVCHLLVHSYILHPFIDESHLHFTLFDN
jgi:hypothetical protein